MKILSNYKKFNIHILRSDELVRKSNNKCNAIAIFIITNVNNETNKQKNIKRRILERNRNFIRINDDTIRSQKRKEKIEDSVKTNKKADASKYRTKQWRIIRREVF